MLQLTEPAQLIRVQVLIGLEGIDDRGVPEKTGLVDDDELEVGLGELPHHLADGLVRGIAVSNHRLLHFVGVGVLPEKREGLRGHRRVLEDRGERSRTHAEKALLRRLRDVVVAVAGEEEQELHLIEWSERERPRGAR